MAYEDPYFGPETVSETDKYAVSELPPEATTARPNISLMLGLIAGALVLIGLITGLVIGKSRG